MNETEKEVRDFLNALSEADKLIEDLYETSLACFMVYEGEIRMIGTKLNELLSLCLKFATVYEFCDRLRQDSSYAKEVSKILGIHDIREHKLIGGLFIYVKEDNDEKGRNNISN